MKPINEMTDQELAEAVAVEVLGWELDQGKWIQPVGAEFISAPESIAGYFGDRLDLNANFREAIENELKRRGWTFSSRYVAIANLHFFEIWIPGGSLEPDYISLQKSFYLAIAKAALKAVRGEDSKKYDGND